MNNLVTTGAGILFMKVGTHARESLADIIDRKSKEIESAGFAMWGYGGNTCHPRTMVQPFAEMFEERGKPILLCMQEINSNHFAEPLRAEEYSPDGLEWSKIPESIDVLGSRFALVITALRQENQVLPLARTKVAIGNSRGRAGDRYLMGRVDKACLEVAERLEANDAEQNEVQINLVAELAAPYAVFLKYHG
jgi:hypothetical protein